MAVNILDNLIVLKVNKTSCEDVLGEMCDAAIEAGYAKPGYHKAILEREAKYPTGLHIPLIEVAIPHADPEWANEPSLTIGILETPVPFRSMDGTGGDVMAGLVFMLTIEEPKDHIDFLRAISNVLGQPELLVEFAKTANPTLIVDKIRANMPEKTKKTESIENRNEKI